MSEHSKKVSELENLDLEKYGDERLGWAWSVNGESFYGDPVATREECIKEASAELRPGQPFWVGQAVCPNMAARITAADIFEHLLNIDIFSYETWSDALEVKPEQEAELTARLRATFSQWLTEVGGVSAFNVEDIERLTVSRQSTTPQALGTEEKL
jgi:hypothetical protein